MEKPTPEEKWRANNSRRYARLANEGRCRRCGKKPKPGLRLCARCLKVQLAWYYRNRDHVKKRYVEYREKLRDAAFAAYGGPVCSCCGERHIEFLTMDHINGDGAAHRKEIGKAAYALYLWLKRNAYPPGFRVLCTNCNFSYGMRGYCPHQKEMKK